MNLSEIFTFENLYQAHQNCRKSKQHKGEVIRFEANLSYNLFQLHQQLITKKYTFGKYKRFLIYEPKERLIEAPPYKDRIVIRCFCDYVLKYKIDSKLIFDNTACRKRKGTDFAIRRLEKFLRKEYREEKNNHIYFLKCDISKYFPSIDHQILLQLLEEIGFSSDEMYFIKKLIFEQPNQETCGLTLGNQSSQWFALLYLNKVDHFIKERLQIKGYVRYMDDMILIHRNKEYLRDCKRQIERICKNELNLNLNKKHK